VTKPIRLSEFNRKIDYWRYGPEFLRDFRTLWPKHVLGCLSEESKTIVTNVAILNDNENSSQKLFSVEKYSSLLKLLRLTALVFKFVHLLKKSYTDFSTLMKQAELYWLKTEQRVHLANELEFLTEDVKNDGRKVPSLVQNLNLFIDESGIFRSRGRFGKCIHFDYDLNNPIILPKLSYLTELYIWKYHELCKHLGVNNTLNSVRNHGFWIPQGRSIVKRVLNNCIICKKLNSFSFRYPKCTDFLADRVNFVTPYKYTGMDYTGHFFVKMGDQTVKMYLLVFTCLNVRSIHLELVPSLSTRDFLLSFIKFVNTYSCPDSIYTDNGSTFISGGKILSESMTDDDTRGYFDKNTIKHVKIPLYSAWMGAAWERLMRTIKNCIYKTIGRQKLEYFQFISLLAEVQCAINSRPLTYRDDDPKNLEIITPNSFLVTRNFKSLSFGSVEGTEMVNVTRKELVKSLILREELIEKFYNLWYESYLLSLRESSRDVYENHWEDRIAKGDIVLINSPFKPRVCWSMGRISELLTGSDGKTRCVKVATPNGEGVYATNLLYPLELSLQEESSSNVETPKLDNPPKTRTTRLAAIKAKAKIKDMCN